MARISLVEQYDNRSVIEQIRALRQDLDASSGGVEQAVADAAEAVSKVNAVTGTVGGHTAQIASLQSGVAANASGIASLESKTGRSTDAPNPSGTMFARIKKNAGDISANAGDIAELDGRTEALEQTTAAAITSADFVASASTVTVVHKHVSQAVDTDAMPVASSTQAGVMNAADYAAFIQMQTDITELKGTVITYPVTFSSSTPTQAEITSAFMSTYPTVPLVRGIKVADYVKGLLYDYDGTVWVQQQFTGSIPVATSVMIGGVKSSAVDGEVAVNAGGTMALNGYDSIVERLDDIDGTGGSVEQIEAEIEALQSADEALGGRLDAVEGDVTDVKADIVEIDSDIVDINDSLTALGTSKQDVGKLTIDSVEYTLAVSTTDAGTAGYITFVKE